jgi:hypothetical protein
VLCGYLGAAPSIVWASGLLFAAAFFVLVPDRHLDLHTWSSPFRRSGSRTTAWTRSEQLRAQRAVAAASAGSGMPAHDAVQAAQASKAALAQWGSP